jgi:predicted transcriptional regulator
MIYILQNISVIFLIAATLIAAIFCPLLFFKIKKMDRKINDLHRSFYIFRLTQTETKENTDQLLEFQQRHKKSNFFPSLYFKIKKTDHKINDLKKTQIEIKENTDQLLEHESRKPRNRIIN